MQIIRRALLVRQLRPHLPVWQSPSGYCVWRRFPLLGSSPGAINVLAPPAAVYFVFCALCVLADAAECAFMFGIACSYTQRVLNSPR